MKKCNLCHKPYKTDYIVKSIIYKDWIFFYKDCWDLISKHKNYSYGGTRKSKELIFQKTNMQKTNKQ